MNAPFWIKLDDHRLVSLHSVWRKEFFETLSTNNPRADFFVVYHKESDVFDREYARKYDDLNTSLIFVSFICTLDANFDSKH